MTDGTPRSLTEAIKNGLEKASVEASPLVAEIVRVHIRDYMAQHFSVVILKNNNTGFDVVLAELFNKSVKP